jgi:hypothetical protein
MTGSWEWATETVHEDEILGALNHYGAEGWELHTETDNGLGTYTLWFKRYTPPPDVEMGQLRAAIQKLTLVLRRDRR